MATNEQRIPVVFDTDPGIDDAMALYLLARHPAIELRAITTVYGNAAIETTTRNAERLSHLYGLTVPIAAGAARPLLASTEAAADEFPAHVHGEDALGGVADTLEAPATHERLDARPAHQLLCDMINAEPGRITVIAVGPMTNLALALRHDPGIVAKVRQVIVMGGAFGMNGHFGNVTPVAEANIINDPEAADLVFTAAWPVVLVGLDVTQEVVMSESFLASLQGRGQGAGNGGKVGDFLWSASRLYQQFYRERDGIEGIYSHDASAVAYAIAPQAFETRPGPVRVVTDGIARGQTIQDFHDMGHQQQSPWSGCPPQRVCVKVDAERVLALFDNAFD